MTVYLEYFGQNPVIQRQFEVTYDFAVIAKKYSTGVYALLDPPAASCN